ncbi:T-complex protein 1 subunit theta-like [Camellia sinensis]|uniref:T-complex protein 1 subunit theta-like n=1 Tax=Camellia sinensis TaxID=4442 RepID=UPI001036D156|nr:T-complex protein 1 subunit theta-like [Camellia sinensis]
MCCGGGGLRNGSTLEMEVKLAMGTTVGKGGAREIVGIAEAGTCRWEKGGGREGELKLGTPNPDDLGYVDSVSMEEIGGVRLKLGTPNPDDLGYVDSVSMEEIGGVRVTIMRNEEGGTLYALWSYEEIPIVYWMTLKEQLMMAICRDNHIVPGAAAIEIELARRMKEFSFKETGLDQYAIAKFAESFEMVPKTLVENAGLNAMEIISSLYAKHASGNTKVGIDLEEDVCKDVSPMNIWDLHDTK